MQKRGIDVRFGLGIYGIIYRAIGITSYVGYTT